MSNVLIAHDPRISQQGVPSHAFQQIQPPTLNIEEVEDEDDKVIVELEDDDEDEFYTLEFYKICFIKKKNYLHVLMQL